MKTLWAQAIEDAVSKTRANIERFGERFPHVGRDGGAYLLNDNTDWTDGFWSGILWLCYEYTTDEAFAEAARRTVRSFDERLRRDIALDHHDIGFLYSLSSKAQWIIEQDPAARDLTIRAADKLLNRWREKGRYIQAWGPKGDPNNGGRIIIDCLMNLPLLFWATEMTGDNRYAEVARIHAELSRRYLVRGDDSSYHTFHFEPESGEPIGGSTHQGYTNGSTWTRGQAWGIYGFALAYRYTRDDHFLETSRRMARYFLERLPEDHVVYWDFDVAAEDSTPRDSSASAITAAGLQELLAHLPAEHPERAWLESSLQKMMEALVRRYSTMQLSEEDGLLRRGSYAVRLGHSPDDYVIWGDYYYLEALMRLERGVPGYWYNRG